jgi:hypothetical protein
MELPVASALSNERLCLGGKHVMRLQGNVLRLLSIVAVLAGAAVAQTFSDGPETVIDVGPGLPGPQVNARMISVKSDNMDAPPVKNTPFCATIATEHTQVFADGNRIHTTDNSTLCRDSEGRTRREAGLNLLGTASPKSSAKLITIVDSVAGLRYMLDANAKIARRMTLPTSPSSASLGAEGGGGQVGFVTQTVAGGAIAGGAMSGPNVVFRKFGQSSDGPAPSKENLGDQTIDGIHATGTRITTTIPSGSMGNEQPMVVTSERWYSPELKATVMTKHNDPWAGELKTQFTNVNTAEPDPSLFTVPADYKIVDEKAAPFMLQVPAPPPPAQP